MKVLAQLYLYKFLTACRVILQRIHLTWLISCTINKHFYQHWVVLFGTSRLHIFVKHVYRYMVYTDRRLQVRMTWTFASQFCTIFLPFYFKLQLLEVPQADNLLQLILSTSWMQEPYTSDQKRLIIHMWIKRYMITACEVLGTSVC